MKIKRAVLDAVVAHAQREDPNECCGFIAVRDGVADKAYRIKNVADQQPRPAPLRSAFYLDPMQQLMVTQAIEDSGAQVGVLYHSHPRSAGEPSQTDLNWAKQMPGVEWLIVGLRGGEVDARSWRIEDAKASEVPIEIIEPG